MPRKRKTETVEPEEIKEEVKKPTRKKKTTPVAPAEEVKEEVNETPLDDEKTEITKAEEVEVITRAHLTDPAPDRSKKNPAFDVLNRKWTQEEKDKSEKESDVTLEYPKGLDKDAMEDLAVKAINHELTPAGFIKILKKYTNVCDEDSINKSILASTEILKKLSVTRQKKLAEELIIELNLMIKERNAIRHGYTQVVNTADVEAWISMVTNEAAKKKKSNINSIKVIEMESYMRPIPDEVYSLIFDAQPYFENFFIVFTDYTGETERQVEKEKRDKDPILFGTFMELGNDGRYVPSRHMFVIADWVDEYCDLTVKQMIEDGEKYLNKNMMIPEDELIKSEIQDIKDELEKRVQTR